MEGTATPQVIAIVADSLRPGHARVQVDDDVYTVDVLAVSELGLRQGQPLTHDAFMALQTAAQIADAKHRALAWLGHRAYTKYEMEKRLQAHGYDVSCCAAVVAWLEQVHYIDDRAYAARWVETRSEAKALGPRRLQQELQQKGVDEQHIHAALSLRDDAYYWEKAYEIARKRWQHHEAEAEFTPQVHRRLTGFLLRRGFHHGTVYRVLARLKGEFRA